MTANPTFLAFQKFNITIIYLGILFTLITTESLKASDLIDNSPFIPDDFNPDYSQLIIAPGKSNSGITRILEFRGF